ncbi:VanW family protein [Streptomyces cheonanensis]|uniref:VanW family protein n=1 Tax=Streptomyces cheonanensis TaxID=312720 RepID=A0ABP5GYV8_9ACTN
MSYSIPPPPAQPPTVHRRGIGRRLAALPRPVLISAVAFVALAAGGVTGYLLMGDGIAEGTTVRGVDIGGLSAEEARAKLEAELGDLGTAPLRVVIGDDGNDEAGEPEIHELDPAEAGLSLDFEATVAAAGNPSLLDRILGRGGGEIELVVHQDEEAGRTALTGLAADSDRTVREGAITFTEGEPEVTTPRAGVALDVEGSLGRLREGYPAAPPADGADPADAEPAADPVPLPVTRAEPLTGEAEIEEALRAWAEPAVAGPVLLTAGDATLTISPTLIGDHLTLSADDTGALLPEFDAAALSADERLDDQLAAAETEPVEAELRLDGGQVVAASPGSNGSTVDRDAIGPAVEPLLYAEGEAARTGTVATEEVEPVITPANYRDLGIVEEMSSFTVEFEPAPYRITNIGRAAELINGSAVAPGEEWSFNRTVGERTEENGFVEGIIILDDQYTNAQGGGVSAVATTMFNAMFFAGVKPVEYGAHSFYIERYPEGREATVAWGHLDLRFLNDSGHTIYILASATDSSVTITFLGTKRYDEVRSETGPRTNVKEPGSREGAAGDACVPQPPLEGFDVEVTRIFVDDGTEAGRETYRTTYVPRDEVLCEGGD